MSIAWKQDLREELAALGHKLTPITRTSLKPKGAELHVLRNSYETGCTHCRLAATIQTFPGSKAAIEIRVPAHPVYKEVLPFDQGMELPFCSKKGGR